jgi:hypothetical protein
MAGAATQFNSLRLSRLESRRLSLALALSLATHLLAWGGYEAGDQFGWWQRWHWPEWLHLPVKIRIEPLLVVPNNEEQLTFVDVNPEQATVEPPANAKYYSSRNSRAANPEANRETGIPQINGKQTVVVKTENVPRPEFNKLQPAPSAPPGNKAQEESRLAPQPGDLTLGRPEALPGQSPERPRTVREAQQQRATRLPGVQMRQDGGVHRQALVPSLDVRATPFGAYDAAFVDAVTYRWYALLDSRQFALDRTGKVVLRFHLNYDGTIADMELLENTVGDLLGYVCREAITDPAPYPAWPSDMRRMVGADYREITFTFYYY